MAHRTIFWRPLPGVTVWLPANKPLGETIRDDVLSGRNSLLLRSFPAREMIRALSDAFATSRVDEAGKLHWTDDADNGFVASFGDQHVEVCGFDLSEEDFEKFLDVAAQFDCEHYDWSR